MMDYTHAPRQILLKIEKKAYKDYKPRPPNWNKNLQNSISGVTFDLSLYWHQYPWTLGEVVCRLRAWISEMWVSQ